jgi:hypothetical protein
MSKLMNLAVALAAFIGGMIANDSYRNKRTVENVAPHIDKLTSRVDKLDVEMDSLAAVRCINVTTPRFDVSIYPVENLGTRKLTVPVTLTANP